MASGKRRTENMALVVKLFEKGFPEDRIHAALRSCKTLSEALAWFKANPAKREKMDKATPVKRRSLGTDAKSLVSQIATPSSSQEGALRLSSRQETCAICFSDAPPQQSVRLGCRHGWYCLHCIKQHADARLSVGDVCVPCPECRAPIQDYSLKEILSHDTIAQFHKRSIKLAIAGSPNLFTCPTANCDFCVEVEDGEEGWLRQCPKCRKGCCLRCGAQPFHKGMSCQMHALRSRSNETTVAEKSFRRWMRRTGTKQCPQCKMGVTKEDLANQENQRKECHKMLCRHCGIRFCFKCLAVLTETYTCGCSINRHGFFNPFTGRRIAHLRAKGSPCKTAASSRSSAAKKSSRHISLSKRMRNK